MSLTTTPNFDFSDLGSNEGNITPGEKAYYIATFEVDQASIDAGGLLNQATVTVSSTGGQVSDTCLLYTSPSPRDRQKSRMPSSA